MGKEALADLSRILSSEASRLAFREKTINPEMHAVRINIREIKQQLRIEILKLDPELLKYITDADLLSAANKYKDELFRRADTKVYTAVRRLESDPNTIISNTYGTFSTALKAASAEAVKHINRIIAKRQIDYIPLLTTKTLELDHTRTVAETRIASEIHRAGIDPLKLIQQLRKEKFIKKEELLQVYKNVLKISSHYSGNNKVFVMEGSVIKGTLKASSENQEEGRSDVAKRANAFRGALRQAIKSNGKWLDQMGSDSYKQYIYKRIGLAIQKAGGTSKYAKPLNTIPASATTTTKVEVKTIVNTYEPTIGLGKSGSAPQAARPMINIAMINNYINSRLAPAIRANMQGPALHNKTGTFSESAKVVGAEVTPEGFPTLLYTYMRSPYDVFDPALGKQPWNKPGRDPKRLIEKSIRDIAQELAIGRFYVRRV